MADLRKIIIVLSFILITERIQTFTEAQEIPEKIQQENYLIHYGYFSGALRDGGDDGGRATAEGFHRAVRLFQKMAGLPETGVVDEMTQKKMKAPRCGVADVLPQDQSGVKRRKRFADSESHWDKTEVSYRVVNAPNPELNITIEDKRTVVRTALQMWSSASAAVLTEVDNDSADIHISFKPRDHGDGFPFDGRGGILAHTFYPQIGDLHFDNDEEWTVNSYDGTNVLYVATHELGHALGLAHSFNPGAIMYPFYQPYDPELKLAQDDINGIQKIFGPSNQTSTVSSESSASTMTPSSVSDVNAPATSSTESPVTHPSSTTYSITIPTNAIDPTSSLSYSSTYNSVTGENFRPTSIQLSTSYSHSTAEVPALSSVLSSALSSSLSSSSSSLSSSSLSSLISSTTQPIKSTRNTVSSTSSSRQALPVSWCQDASIDAATNIREVVYFFKGDSYAAVNEFGVIPGYPKLIQESWAEVPSNVDSVLYWQDLDQLYFFKGNTTWRYNGRVELDPWYPKPIWDKFRKLPGSIDASFIYSGDGDTYFIKGAELYRYNRLNDAVDEGYPQSTTVWKGLPQTIDTAFQWNNKTYFFSADSFYRFDDSLHLVEAGYPRPTAYLWFHCGDHFSM